MILDVSELQEEEFCEIEDLPGVRRQRLSARTSMGLATKGPLFGHASSFGLGFGLRGHPATSV